MKFKFLYDVGPNMFGVVGGKITLIGDPLEGLNSIEWFIDKIRELSDTILDGEELRLQEEGLIEAIKNLRINDVLRINDRFDKVIGLVMKVDDSTTMADLIEEEYGI